MGEDLEATVNKIAEHTKDISQHVKDINYKLTHCIQSCRDQREDYYSALAGQKYISEYQP